MLCYVCCVGIWVMEVDMMMIEEVIVMKMIVT